MNKRPICPECNESMTFLQSFKNINPWNYKCPNCKKKIVAPKLWKSITIACFIMGFCAGIFASYKEEQGAWTANTSWLFFGLCLLVLIPITTIIWTRLKFKSLSDKCEQ